MEFRILGPLEIVVDGRPVPTPAPRLCALLTTLLLRPHRVVPIGELIDRLWADETLPANPTSSIHTYVRRLRAIVGADVLQTRPGGYLLAAEAADLVAFRSYLAKAADEPAREVEHLQRALDQWRGDPLAVEHHYAVGLVEERLTALEQYYDARLAQGDHTDLLPELRASSARELLRERFSAQLMIALYRCGRQAEALAAYDEIAARLVDQFGLDPGDELRELRQSILTSTLEPEPRPTGDWVRQNHLPLDIRTLVGRDDLVGQIVRLAAQTDGVPIVVLTGTPGVGKTALAVRSAHQLSSSFPDGLWFVRLRGASDQPRRPDDVLVELLRSSGLDPSAIPDDLDARAAAFRARLAGRRVLLVLDDARDAAQVRPFLPGTAGSAVLVTSRHALDSLVALDGAIGLRVATLTPDDGAALIASLLGRPYDSDIAELVAMCAGLPLALRIAGAVASRGPVSGLVDRMRAAGALPVLTIDDDTAVSTAFTTSYDLLDPATQRGFRLLSLFPGPEFGSGAAQALIGRGYAEVLARLESASLLQPVGAGRYVMHDLVKQYAGQRAEPDAGAWNSLCAWYIGTADCAVDTLFPTAVRVPVTSYERRPVDDAAGWLESELINIEAVATRAQVLGPPDAAWLLADILRVYLYEHSLIDAWRRLVRLGAGSAAGNRLGEGAIEHALGVLDRITGDASGAVEHVKKAIELYRSGGFELGEAALLCNLGLAYNDRGQLTDATEALSAGIAIFRGLGEVRFLPRALLNLSMNHEHLGRFHDAIDCTTEYLEIKAAEGDPDTLAAYVNRAGAYCRLGDLEKAAADLQTATLGADRRDVIAWRVAMAALRNRQGKHSEALQYASDAVQDSLDIRSAYHESLSRMVVGECHLEAGDHVTARTFFEQADALATKSGYDTMLADTHCLLAQCTYLDGRTATAHELAAAALAELEAVQYRVGEYHAQVLLARCCTDLGRDDEAAVYRAAAARMREETGYVPSR
ncbi:BTAD domain-containing putative transcriptional regulator [Kribbella sp. NBC_00889]|uniref:AfsR/SARP family transcriptional regulator n=1 Tax=Kribbella sp. NBC_00889 TaxID=2975974 RepID=UPI00386CFDB2|nr:NB-ARC domain-containing protein [Kribbella sp. NBC_00889]